jgi:hypothetical protein
MRGYVVSAWMSWYVKIHAGAKRYMQLMAHAPNNGTRTRMTRVGVANGRKRDGVG